MKSVILILILLAGTSLALSDVVKQCVKVCCENAGGVYGWQYNSCENFTQDMTECALKCQEPEPKPGICPAGFIVFAFAALMVARRGR